MTELERLKQQTLCLQQQTLCLLGDIISAEAAKPDGEADLALMDECEAFMCSLLAGEASPSDAEIRARVKALTCGHGRNIAGRYAEDPSAAAGPRRYVSRAAVILCAVLLLCVSVCAVWAMHPAHRRGNGGTGREDAAAIVCLRGDEVSEYRSMETLLVAEGLDLMYPHLLPEGVAIERLVVAAEEPFSAQLCFVGQAGNIRIDASGAPSDVTEMRDAQTVRFGERLFYIWHGRIWWHALTVDDRYTYSITYRDEAGLFTVMEGFFDGVSKEEALPAWAETTTVRCTGCGSDDLEMVHGFVEEETDRMYCTVSHHYHCIWTCGSCGAEGTVSHCEHGIKHLFHCSEREHGYLMHCINCGYEFPLK